MRTETGKTISRHDWQPFPYSITQLDLDFDLDPTLTTVKSSFVATALTSEPKALVVDGENLALQRIHVNGKALRSADYVLSEQTVVVYLNDHENRIEIVSTCQPALNTTLMGLYVSGEQLFTQCEPEGFRRITWFPD